VKSEECAFVGVQVAPGQQFLHQGHYSCICRFHRVLPSENKILKEEGSVQRVEDAGGRMEM
jgi:hypothetical protein